MDKYEFATYICAYFVTTHAASSHYHVAYTLKEQTTGRSSYSAMWVVELEVVVVVRLVILEVLI